MGLYLDNMNLKVTKNTYFFINEFALQMSGLLLINVKLTSHELCNLKFTLLLNKKISSIINLTQN